MAGPRLCYCPGKGRGAAAPGRAPSSDRSAPRAVGGLRAVRCRLRRGNRAPVGRKPRGWGSVIGSGPGLRGLAAPWPPSPPPSNPSSVRATAGGGSTVGGMRDRGVTTTAGGVPGLSRAPSRLQAGWVKELTGCGASGALFAQLGAPTRPTRAASSGPGAVPALARFGPSALSRPASRSPAARCPGRALTAHPVEVPNAALLRPFSETLILGAAPAAPLGSLGRGESGC